MDHAPALDLALPVYDERGGAFAKLRDARVLIYWPHGFGDFVHLSYVLPFLEPSNTYFITRFGDDFVHLYDGEPWQPIYSGQRRIGSGTEFGVPPHFGIDFKRIRNRVERLRVAQPLHDRIRDARIDAMLYTDYPEKTGRIAYPFHSKLRHIIGKLVDAQRLSAFDLSKPISPGIAFRAPAQCVQRVEERLRALVSPGERLYVVSAGGHTQLDKIWPEHDVLALAQRLAQHDRGARVITIDERTSAQIGRAAGAAPTTADVFEGLDVPFAHVMTTLIRASHAYIGVASGPYHCAVAIGGRPIVGIFLAHWPEYYDEPSAAIALVGPNVFAQSLHERIGAYTKKRSDDLAYRIVAFRERAPNADDVIEALSVA